VGEGLRWRRPGQISAAQPEGVGLAGGQPSIGLEARLPALDFGQPQEAACAAWGVSWWWPGKARSGNSGVGMWVRESRQVEGPTGARLIYQA